MITEEGRKKLRLGAINSTIVRHNNCEEKYNDNPKLCKQCDKAIPYENRRNVFCNHSCATTHLNNKRYITIKRYCKQCNKLINNTDYCVDCARTNKFNDGQLKYNRKYLLNLRGNKCEQCGLSEWNGKEIPVDIHHIDGNRNNNFPNNLIILCRNCHGQTNTFGYNKQRVSIM